MKKKDELVVRWYGGERAWHTHPAYLLKFAGRILWATLLDYGPGYRVYFKRVGQLIIVLLAGGDKSTQDADIALALRLARNLEESS